MTTAIIGAGNIGRTIATHLVAGGEPVVLAARDEPEGLAKELGNLATTATVPAAIEAADVVVFALWLDDMKGVIEQHRARLTGKVVVDPSNPIAVSATGEISRTLPDDVSAGSVVAGLLPHAAHFVKAFGTLSAGTLEKAANRMPERAVLFYATDDPDAQTAIEGLISIAGFDPVKAGGLNAAARIEFGGDLSEFGLGGQLVNVKDAQAAVARLG